MEKLIISLESIDTAEAAQLLDELSNSLLQITGNDGRANFHHDDVRKERAAFAVARSLDGKPLGCGALRTLTEQTAEIKRVYARPNSCGTGAQLLAFLEQTARTFGYNSVRLQTRCVNERAVQFYLRNGYAPIANYGIYQNREDGISFHKGLS